jgi:integrase
LVPLTGHVTSSLAWFGGGALQQFDIFAQSPSWSMVESQAFSCSIGELLKLTEKLAEMTATSDELRELKTFVQPCLAFWEKALAKETPVARITTARVEEIKLRRADAVAEATVDRSVQALKAFFNWLIDQDLAAINPVRRVRMFHPNNEVVRYLTRDQYDALLTSAEAGPAYLRPLIVLAVHTALRRGNLLRLRWREVDLGARKIRVAELTKGKKTLEVPVNDSAKSALEDMRRLAVKDNDFVFAVGKSHITDIKNPFTTALKRAKVKLVESDKKDAADGLVGFRFHDLRHHAESRIMPSPTTTRPGGGEDLAIVCGRHSA